MKSQPLSAAFRHAFHGMAQFFRMDRNGKLHLGAAMLVAIAGWFFRLSGMEWCVLLLCMALVIGLEMLNYALENLCNLVHKDFHPLIKTTKDVAAGAVLWAAIISVVIGAVIFIPRIVFLWHWLSEGLAP
jgi:diacylglycerol kinase